MDQLDFDALNKLEDFAIEKEATWTVAHLFIDWHTGWVFQVDICFLRTGKHAVYRGKKLENAISQLIEAIDYRISRSSDSSRQ